MELQQAVELSKRVQNEIKKSVKGKDDWQMKSTVLLQRPSQPC